MPKSYSQSGQAPCPSCGQDVPFEVWLIVDVAERPDLLARAREGKLNAVKCPHCGHEGRIGTPLLIHDAERQRLLLAVPPGLTDEQAGEINAQLVGRLLSNLGDGPRPDYLGQTQVVPLDVLPAVLADDPEAALRQLAEQAAAKLEQLRQENPEAYQQLAEAAQQAMPPLLQTIQEFIRAESWAESQRILEQHPELLSDQADALLGQLLDAARAQNDEGAERILGEHRTLLRRCREVGIAQAFAERSFPPEVLERATAAGISPEQLLETAHAAAQMSPELRAALAELTATGAEIRSPEDLERLLEAHPELREKLEAAVSTTGSGPEVPANISGEFNRLIQRQQQAENSPYIWPEVIAAWEAFLKQPEVQNAPLLQANSQGNLANACLRLYEVTGDDSWARRGELLLKGLLSVFTRQDHPQPWATTQHSLGNLYLSRYERSGDDAHAQAAEQRFHLVLSAAARYSLPLIFPFRAAAALARLNFRRTKWQETIATYEQATDALGGLYQTLVLRESKEAWLRETQGLPARAAYALAKTSKLREAVVTLEAGRARLLAETLEQTRRDLERLQDLGYADLLERYRQAAKQIQALQQQVESAGRPTPGKTQLHGATLSQAMETAQAEVRAAIEEIRRVPGYEDFFLPPTFAKIAQAMPPDTPLVYLLATPVGGLALIVQQAHQASATVEAVWLDTLTEAKLMEVLRGPADDPTLGGYLGAYDRWRHHSREEEARQAWFSALDQTTRWLWDVAMGPLVRRLTSEGGQNRGSEGVKLVTLIPTGLLSLLPLHAAWIEDATAPTGRRYALDALAFNYAPSARALATVQETATRVAPNAILAVDNPDGSLLFSTQEVAAVLSYFPPEQSKALRGQTATQQAVQQNLPHYPVLHLSTHGWAGWQEPLESGLLMAGDPPLTLGDILELRLERSRLAVLSACETGIPGTKLPDEVISLPAGLMQAGVAGVAASLWSVNDLSTAMLMERFYRLWRVDGLVPALALREAQRWLRDTTNREKAEYFQRDVPVLAQFRMPALTAASFFTDMMIQKQLDARGLAHPFWWAAFYLTGV